MTWTNNHAAGTRWHAWVRPHGDHWRWEATCLGCPAVWEPAPTAEDARAEAEAWIRKRAAEVLADAARVLDDLG